MDSWNNALEFLFTHKSELAQSESSAIDIINETILLFESGSGQSSSRETFLFIQIVAKTLLDTGYLELALSQSLGGPPTHGFRDVVLLLLKEAYERKGRRYSNIASHLYNMVKCDEKERKEAKGVITHVETTFRKKLRG